MRGPEKGERAKKGKAVSFQTVHTAVLPLLKQKGRKIACSSSAKCVRNMEQHSAAALVGRMARDLHPHSCPLTCMTCTTEAM